MSVFTISTPNFNITNFYGAFASFAGIQSDTRIRYLNNDGFYVELRGTALDNTALGVVTSTRLYSDSSFLGGTEVARITGFAYEIDAGFVLQQTVEPTGQWTFESTNTLYTGGGVVTGTSAQLAQYKTRVAVSTADLTSSVTLIIAPGGAPTVIDIAAPLGTRAASITGSSDADSVLTGGGDDNVSGGEGSDKIAGGAGADSLSGGGGDDFLFAGSVTVAGGVWTMSTAADTAVDTLTGGAGNDRYFVNGSNDIVIETADNGTADVVYANNWTAATGVDVEFIRAASGYATGANLVGNEIAQYMSGWTLADTLSGGGGNDILDGMGGADTMSGGMGDDKFYVDNSGDVVNEAVGEGTDLVYATNWVATVGSHIEWIRASGNTAVNLTGNEFSQQIHANGTASVAANDILNGGGGNDSVFGYAGNDTLNGGTGNDNLVGGTGSDVFVFSAAWGADVVRDFQDGVDLLDLSVTGATAIGNLTITQSGTATLISYNGNTISMLGTTAANFTAADFDFVI